MAAAGKFLAECILLKTWAPFFIFLDKWPYAVKSCRWRESETCKRIPCCKTGGCRRRKSGNGPAAVRVDETSKNQCVETVKGSTRVKELEVE